MILSVVREGEATKIIPVNDFDINNARIKNLEKEIQKHKRTDEEMKIKHMKVVSSV